MVGSRSATYKESSLYIMNYAEAATWIAHGIFDLFCSPLLLSWLGVGTFVPFHIRYFFIEMKSKPYPCTAMFGIANREMKTENNSSHLLTLYNFYPGQRLDGELLLTPCPLPPGLPYRHGGGGRQSARHGGGGRQSARHGGGGRKSPLQRRQRSHLSCPSSASRQPVPHHRPRQLLRATAAAATTTTTTTTTAGGAWCWRARASRGGRLRTIKQKTWYFLWEWSLAVRPNREQNKSA